MIVLTCKRCGSEQLKLGNAYCDFICDTCGHPLQMHDTRFMSISVTNLKQKLNRISDVQNSKSAKNLPV